MINSLQGLRGVFFILIFLHHISFNGNSLLPQGGSMGVSFFIVLSGFVMFLNYQDRVELPTFNYKDYVMKKVFKVYPIHLLCFFLFLIITPYSILNCFNLSIVPNLLLLQSWIPKQFYYFSGNALSWYLSDAIFFYVAFPFIVNVVKSNQYKIVLGVMIFLYVLFVLLLPDKLIHPILYINPLFRLVEFVLGCVLCNFYKKNKDNINKWNYENVTILQIISVFLIAMSFYFYPLLEIRFSYVAIWIIPMLFLVFSFSFTGFLSKLASNCIFVFLGKYSLYFYMLHLLIIQANIRLFDFFYTNEYYISFLVIISFVITLVSGVIIAKYIDKPIVKRLTSYANETKRV